MAIEHGRLTPEEARNHPHRHVVRRHMGADPKVRAGFRLRLSEAELPEHSMRNQGVLLDPGSRLVLCSDGLSDVGEPDEILRILDRNAPQGSVDELILLARKRGGHDNITVIVIQV